VIAMVDQTAPKAVNPGRTLFGRDIVCFSHDWGGDPLSKTHLMRLLAHDNRVLWVNSIGYRKPNATKRDLSRVVEKLWNASRPVVEAEPNLFVLNTPALPIFGPRWAWAVNRGLVGTRVRATMRRLGFERPINWVFNPTASVVAGALGESSLIYHCVDEYSAFSGVSPGALAAMEDELLDRADLVIASSESLAASKSRPGRPAALVRHGVDWEHFRRALDSETAIPVEVAGLPRPIIGYFGLIAEDWVDLDLLARVAGRFAGGSLVLLGKANMDLSPLLRLPNVHWLGRRPYEELPGFCKAFEVGLIPFPINRATLNSNPLKLREYLAAGLPVVSTAIPEVESLGLARVAGDAEAFGDQVEAALADRTPRASRSEALRLEGWGARLEEIRALYAGTRGWERP
jgi:glycosyltransferase involved in cell wall biosynthesis